MAQEENRTENPQFEPRDEKKITVVYMAGSGRMGSTLVERLLETYDNVVSVGELGMLWVFVTRLKFELSDIMCPCGEALPDCPNWRAILEAADFSDAELEEMISLQRAALAPWRSLIYFLPVVNRAHKKRLRRLAVLTGRFYHAAARVAGADIVIDCSLNPSGALLARHIDNIDLNVKHMVRRPEAVTYSWSVRKFHPGFSQYSDALSPLHAILRWIGPNLRTEMLRFVMPVSRYSYEWFVTSPQTNLKTLMADVPQFRDSVSGAFVSENEIDLEAGHAILGNPDRFRSGRTVINSDERFRTKLPWLTRKLAVLLTLPFYLRYGFGSGEPPEEPGGRPKDTG